ncbi:family 43 glycosylhydrolase [Plantibacter sp. ME-Dv--P-122b]|uniref:family 43 glycosylhydrolase n=1 Tax=Plantibacter sp. ME-Dv--P-122b TaxID=3040300 RepID=UPI00254AF1D3|nr:family 43 glycosylhydrolase [Plantibacter sp. ME-Dv--P-122b]
MTELTGFVPLAAESSSPLVGYYADPDLVHGETGYVLAVTSDGHEAWGANEFHLFTSQDLVEWQDLGVVFDVRETGWAHGFAWAPAYLAHNGRHYLFFTANRGEIGVAVADEVGGPYIDSGRPLVAAEAFDGIAIDPSVFRDEDGSIVLYWGNGIAHAVRLDDDLLGFDPASVVSWEPEEFREAIMVHRRGDRYYASWSADDTRSPDYRVHYATGPTPFGPWEHRGIVLQKHPDRGIVATGHHSITNVLGTSDWVIAYHRFAIPGGDGYRREVRFDRLHHREDGLLDAVTPSQEPLRIPSPPRRK